MMCLLLCDYSNDFAGSWKSEPKALFDWCFQFFRYTEKQKIQNETENMGQREKSKKLKHQPNEPQVIKYEWNLMYSDIFLVDGGFYRL